MMTLCPPLTTAPVTRTSPLPSACAWVAVSSVRTAVPLAMAHAALTAVCRLPRMIIPLVVKGREYTANRHAAQASCPAGPAALRRLLQGVDEEAEGSGRNDGSGRGTPTRRRLIRRARWSRSTGGGQG